MVKDSESSFCKSLRCKLWEHEEIKKVPGDPDSTENTHTAVALTGVQLGGPDLP